MRSKYHTSLGKMQKFIKKYTWKEIRSKVKKLSPELCKAIDSVNPSSRYKLYLVTYPYGQHIIKDGKFHVPEDMRTSIPLEEAHIDSSTKNMLNIPNLPIGMVLEKGAELYVKYEERIMPYAIYKPGDMLGLADIFTESGVIYSNAPLWNMTSGARSIFLLPKISEEISHSRLKDAYSFNITKPNSFSEHFDIFRSIAQNDNQSSWACQVLFFGKNWFEHKQDDAWSIFNCFFYQKAWHEFRFQRKQNFLNTLASIVQNKRKIKFSPYILEIIIHLINTAFGDVPGLSPVTDESLFPTASIQNAYINNYGLNYAPVLMGPQYFSEQTPVYYSLNYPSSLNFSLKRSAKTSNLFDLYEIGNNLKKYLKEVQSNELQLEHTTLYSLTKHANFILYHGKTNTEGYSNILNTENMAEDDKNFQFAHYSSLPFPKSSSFFNGCIKIIWDNKTSE